MAGARTIRHDPSVAALASNPFIGHAGHHASAGYVDLSVCRFDPPLVVTDALANDTEGLLRLIGGGHHTAGLPDLRDALAHTLTSLGLPSSPAQLLITTGSQQALALVASELERNDRVMIEDPTYFGAMHAYLGQRAKLIPFAIDETETARTLAAHERRVDLIHVTSAIHNPTGRQLSRRAGERLVDLAAQCGATLVDDHALRYLADLPRPFLATHDSTADIITIGSFSKVLWSALRVGWLRAPTPTITRLSARKAALDLATPALDQGLVLHCLPHLDVLAALRRQQLSHSRSHARQLLAEQLPDWHDEGHEHGPFLWLRTNLHDAEPLREAAHRAGVGLTAGRTLTPTEHWNGHIRLSITASDDELDTAIDRLAQICLGASTV
ncbi:MAG: PLP-dependent aminotransferase family protein [Ilumatobacteraceae bacterium]